MQDSDLEKLADSVYAIIDDVGVDMDKHLFGKQKAISIQIDTAVNDDYLKSADFKHRALGELKRAGAPVEEVGVGRYRLIEGIVTHCRDAGIVTLTWAPHPDPYLKA